MTTFPFKEFDENIQKTCFALWGVKFEETPISNLTLDLYEAMLNSNKNQALANESDYRHMQSILAFYIYFVQNKFKWRSYLYRFKYARLPNQTRGIISLTIQSALESGRFQI
jgi:site-specific recombinase XerD